MNLTVLILAKNEQANIRYCIESVLFADEIIVIDDDSTDDTARIATALGAKVIRRTMNGNWGEQQTFAIQQASSQWVYFIDADERMTPELAAAVQQAVKSNEKYAYLNARLNHFWGQELRYGGWYPDYGIHLLPKEGSYVTGFVHPQIHHQYPQRKIKEHLIHYPYRSWEHYFNKLNRYTELAAAKNKAKGKQANFLLDIMLRPWVAFIKMYILKSGWRDGKIGFVLAVFHFFYTMAKYVKLYYLDKDNSHEGRQMKILVHSLVNLGDVILTTGAVALLRQAYPQAYIVMMVRPAMRQVLENNPVIDEVLVFDYKGQHKSIKKQLTFLQQLKSYHFTMSISLDRKLRPALLTWLAGIPQRFGPSQVFDPVKSKVTLLYTDVVPIDHDIVNTLQAETYQAIVRFVIGNPAAQAKPVIAPPKPANTAKAARLLAALPAAKYKIGLCVKGTFPLKTWPKEYFVKVVEALNDKYSASFFIIGAPEDEAYAAEVIAQTAVPIANFCGKTDLLDLAAIFQQIDLFITVDTGAAHIAATIGLPMVVMYGCTSPKRWQPINDRAAVLTTNESCCPCKIAAAECVRPKCLWNITPEMVIATCEERINP